MKPTFVNNINLAETSTQDQRRAKGGAIVFTDGTQLPTGPHPFFGYNKELHNNWDAFGRWIGHDLTSQEEPYRSISSGVSHTLTGKQITDTYVKYRTQDYGTGEAGFAVYQVDGHEVWLIDDAVRTPEGEQPARDPLTSPGPQTMLLPHEY